MTQAEFVSHCKASTAKMKSEMGMSTQKFRDHADLEGDKFKKIVEEVIEKMTSK